MEHIKNKILLDVPHRNPYRFVDEIDEVDEDHIVGKCFLEKDAFFYKGHFPESTITPGFIITEIMAQIGILCLGLFLVKDYQEDVKFAFLSNANVKFKNLSYPNDTIIVKSKKIHFRFNTLKCHVDAFNQDGIILCSGILTGVIQRNIKE